MCVALDCRVEQGGVDADGQADGQPDDQHHSPGNQEAQGVGQHGSSDGTDAGLLVVLLGEDDDNGVVGHQRSDDVGAAVTDTVGQLAQLGAVAQQHEHGNEDRSQDVPLCGSMKRSEISLGTALSPSIINLKIAAKPIPANTVDALAPPSSPARSTSAQAVPSG